MYCSILLTFGSCNSLGRDGCEKKRKSLQLRLILRKQENKHMDKQPEEVASTSTTKATAPQESGRRLRGIALFSVLGALMLTLLLEALDQTVVGTALPRIIGSLQGFDRYTWAVTAYTVASGIMS